MNKNEAFDSWAAETLEDGTPRYQKLYDSWYKHDNSALEWQQYYWALRKAFEAGQHSV